MNFLGSGFANYNLPTPVTTLSLAFSFFFRSSQTTGAMVRVGSAGILSDHMQVGLYTGHIRVLYNIGSGTATGISNKTYNDNFWHLVTVTMSGPNATVSIDATEQFSMTSPVGSTTFNNITTVTLGLDGVNILNDYFYGNLRSMLIFNVNPIDLAFNHASSVNVS